MNTKILIGLFATLAVAVVILFVVKSKADKKAKDAAAAAATATPAPAQPAPPVRQAPVQGAQSGYPITYMKYSEPAKTLQAALGVKQDGYIGDITLTAWKKYSPNINKDFTVSNADVLAYYIQQIKANPAPVAAAETSGWNSLFASLTSFPTMS